MLTALSLSGLVLLTPRESSAQERPTPQEKPTQEKPADKPAQQKPAVTQEKTAQTRPTPTVEPSVSTALNDLRRSVVAELGKSPALAGKTIDDQKVLITTSRRDSIIAGAAAPARVALGLPPANQPGTGATDPTKPDRVPTDATKPVVDPADDPNAVGVVLLMGSFAPQSGTRGNPADSGVRSTNTFGGTYIVRRKSTSSREVEIVDSRQQVVATVPLLYFDTDARPIESGARDTGAPAGTGTTGTKGTTDGTGAAGATGAGAQRDTGTTSTFPNVEGDWARIYMSIVHYFNPDLG